MGSEVATTVPDPQTGPQTETAHKSEVQWRIRCLPQGNSVPLPEVIRAGKGNFILPHQLPCEWYNPGALVQRSSRMKELSDVSELTER